MNKSFYVENTYATATNNELTSRGTSILGEVRNVEIPGPIDFFLNILRFE